MAKPAMAPAMAADDDEAAGAAPMAGAEPSAEGADEGEEVLVTITKNPDGGYCVYSGDEPEDEAAEGGEGEGAPAEGATPAEGEDNKKEVATIGEALKAAMDILNEEEGEDGESQEGNFQAGFKGGGDSEDMGGAGKPTLGQKY